MNTVFLGYEPWYGDVTSMHNGVLVASEHSVAVTYGIHNAERRGLTMIEPDMQVYEGMIVWLNSRVQNILVNVCKEKKKTNVRSSTQEIMGRLTPPVRLNLEQAIDFINKDELVEVIPQNIRLRKKLFTYSQRLRSVAATARSIK